MKYYLTVQVVDGQSFSFEVEASSPADAMNCVDAMKAGQLVRDGTLDHLYLVELNTRKHRGVEYIPLREWVR